MTRNLAGEWGSSKIWSLFAEILIRENYYYTHKLITKKVNNQKDLLYFSYLQELLVSTKLEKKKEKTAGYEWSLVGQAMEK